MDSFFYKNKSGRASKSSIDLILFWVFIILLSIGLVMVYSTTIAKSIQESSINTYHLIRQLIYILIGFSLFLLMLKVKIKKIKDYSIYFFIFGLFLLIIVLIPGIGKDVNGSTRWIPLFLFNVQPSEIMKLLVVLYASNYAVRKTNKMASFKKGFLPMLIVMLLTGFLLLKQPDLGAFVVMMIITMGILFLAGMSIGLFVLLALLLTVGFIVLVLLETYRIKRFMTFLDPWADPFGAGYQLTNALIAIGRGEWLGVGLGASIEKLGYLPESHTDFIFSIFAEELGVIGIFLLISFFVILCWRGFSIASKSNKIGKHYSSLVAYGIILWIASQAIINMAVNMGLVPTKGLSLPFISYGGSAMISNCIGLGILLRIDYENKNLIKGG